MPYIALISFVLSLIHLLFVFLVCGDGIDVENLISGRENAVTLISCTLCLFPIYLIDRRVIKFQTEARWYSQIIKLVLGLGIVLLIKEGMKVPLGFLFKNDYLARAVRYFLVVMFAGCVWPLTFGFFSRLKISFLDNLFEKHKAK